MKVKILLLTALFSHFLLLAQDNSQQSTVLSNIGTSSALLIYNTYGYLGVLADGTTKEVYEAAYVSSLTAEQEVSLKNAADSYSALLASKYISAPIDVKYVQDLIECLNHLRNEATALGKYVQSKSQEDFDNYTRERSAAWNIITALLHIKTDNSDAH